MCNRQCGPADFHCVRTLHFDRCFGLILSKPGDVSFFTDNIACRIAERKTSGTTKSSTVRSHRDSCEFDGNAHYPECVQYSVNIMTKKQKLGTKDGGSETLEGL
ncbi:hypothetical protein KIN20_027579 [Parelaphostrongylus tenuis]|uniref:Uncharacterized protein n=1 Tax=Parelaphostrongylus tenuis TaxID=148309 RepID=A0AAD5QZN1_PARTN|nr:hypothetical protein KIN20_027579 [Parelaphostrongylus tenuis]